MFYVVNSYFPTSIYRRLNVVRAVCQVYAYYYLSPCPVPGAVVVMAVGLWTCDTTTRTRAGGADTRSKFPKTGEGEFIAGKKKIDSPANFIYSKDCRYRTEYSPSSFTLFSVLHNKPSDSGITCEIYENICTVQYTKSFYIQAKYGMLW